MRKKEGRYSCNRLNHRGDVGLDKLKTKDKNQRNGIILLLISVVKFVERKAEKSVSKFGEWVYVTSNHFFNPDDVK